MKTNKFLTRLQLLIWKHVIEKWGQLVLVKGGCMVGMHIFEHDALYGGFKIMKRILLLCAAGITTSLLTKKLDDLIRRSQPEEYQDYCLSCYGSKGLKVFKQKFYLLKPSQVRFNYAKDTTDVSR